MQKIILSITLFALSNSIMLCQSNIKIGEIYGIELRNSFSNNTGSFSKSLDYTFGLYTGINLYSFYQSAILLRLEADYTKLHYYNPGRKINYVVNTSAANWNGLDYAVFDEKYMFNFITLDLLPEYHLQLSKKTSIELFVGPSVGIGATDVNYKQLDKNSLISDPYDEYGMIPVTTFNMTVGISFYYYLIVFDVRYRYVSFAKNSSIKTNFNNVYTQVGIAF